MAIANDGDTIHVNGSFIYSSTQYINKSVSIVGPTFPVLPRVFTGVLSSELYFLVVSGSGLTVTFSRVSIVRDSNPPQALETPSLLHLEGPNTVIIEETQMSVLSYNYLAISTFNLSELIINRPFIRVRSNTQGFQT